MARVLLVEDEDSVRLLYQQELEDEGYHVLIAKNGKEAIQLLENNKLEKMTVPIEKNENDL